ncbi:MAG: formiminoglutamase [Luteibaculaceae bacterium]|jgi:formiminoglutamase
MLTPGTHFSHHHTPRVGETRVGEHAYFFGENWKEELHSFSGQFVILCIQEDIGPQANCGFPGAKNSADLFFKAILNLQHNRFNPGDEYGILGEFVFEKKAESLEDQRTAVAELDTLLAPIFEALFKANKTPIVIGGGHNNAYPIIKALGKKSPCSVLNIDPHADFRPREGRHSGNGFSYAFEEGFLGKYGMFGLHENYNSENMLLEMEEHPFKISYTFFEETLDMTWEQVLEKLKKMLIFLEEKSMGLEIDLDGISFFPSSAISPIGFTPVEMRKLLRFVCQTTQMDYLHLPEGHLTDPVWNKLLAYLVSDFIKHQRIA